MTNKFTIWNDQLPHSDFNENINYHLFGLWDADEIDDIILMARDGQRNVIDYVKFITNRNISEYVDGGGPRDYVHFAQWEVPPQEIDGRWRLINNVTDEHIQVHIAIVQPSFFHTIGEAGVIDHTNTRLAANIDDTRFLETTWVDLVVTNVSGVNIFYGFSDITDTNGQTWRWSAGPTGAGFPTVNQLNSYNLHGTKLF